MQKNDLLKTENGIYRILKIDGDRVLAIDCQKRTMPRFYPSEFFDNAETVDNSIVMLPCDFDSLSRKERSIAQQRFSMIASAVAVVDDEKKRNDMIQHSAAMFGVSKATIRNYLCTYLVSQEISSLVCRPKKEKELTKDQRNMRWALNKFFYTQHRNSLSTAYTMMLKEKYCDESGVLKTEHPTFNQFRYFYRKAETQEEYWKRKVEWAVREIKKNNGTVSVSKVMKMTNMRKNEVIRQMEKQ